MSKYKKLSHVIYKCDYHIVWVPKYRFRILTGQVKSLLEEEIKMLCEWKKCEIHEMSVQIDHIHLVVSVPPRVSIYELMGILKGKLAIMLFKSYPKMKQKPYWGNHFRARGYFVSTVGTDEDVKKRYVKHQEKEEKLAEDPAVSDVIYIENLVAPFTVNTMPENTLLAFANHGKVEQSMPFSCDLTNKLLDDFKNEGVNIETLAGQLQNEGAESFVGSWNHLLKTIGEKRKSI